MQVTRPEDLTEEEAEKVGALRKEFFSQPDVQRHMEARLIELEKHGEVLVRRKTFEREELVEEAIQTVKELATAHNRQQRRRLKKLACKIIQAI